MKKGRSALARLRRLAGQMGLTSDNCRRRKVMTACVRSVARYSTELWWRCEGKQGMTGGEEELQNFSLSGQARRGQGELPQGTGGL